jgi:hypothetical protein
MFTQRVRLVDDIAERKEDRLNRSVQPLPFGRRGRRERRKQLVLARTTNQRFGVRRAQGFSARSWEIQVDNGHTVRLLIGTARAMCRRAIVESKSNSLCFVADRTGGAGIDCEANGPDDSQPRSRLGTIFVSYPLIRSSVVWRTEGRCALL